MKAASELRCLLEGKSPGLMVPPDVTLGTQGEETFVPVIKRTVCYIVCGVLFNEGGDILMMQEAKRSCFGLWYLPAGRMEPDETIEEAVQREVLEETGIKFQPTTLLTVEVNAGSWYRFTLTGHVTGGCLKTTDHKDQESLQAKWCTLEQINGHHTGFPLRGTDILPLIDQAVRHRSDPSPHRDLMPALSPLCHLLLRTVFLHTNPDRSVMHMLVCRDPQAHFPVGIISPRVVGLQITIRQMVQVILGHVEVMPKILGILALEHSGKPARTNDGLCLSLLISLTTKDGELPKTHNPEYEWCSVTGDLATEVNSRCQPGKLIQLSLLL